MYPSAAHLSTFVQRTLLPVLESTQQCPEDLCLLRTLRSTPVSYLGRIAYNDDTIRDVLVGLRLQFTIWEPLDENWRRTTRPFLSSAMHIQVVQTECDTSVTGRH